MPEPGADRRQPRSDRDDPAGRRPDGRALPTERARQLGRESGPLVALTRAVAEAVQDVLGLVARAKLALGLLILALGLLVILLVLGVVVLILQL